ncbi:MAG: cytochrome c [Bacteroidetes bacterium]|nr:MAG: cytochrome c [Bacteroidota bacterium]
MNGMRYRGAGATCIYVLALLACGSPEADRQGPAATHDAVVIAAPDTTAGARLYQAHCAACHMAKGGGVPGLNPPLRQTDWVTGAPEQLIRIVLEGQSGPIEVNGQAYDSQMPGFPHLGDTVVAQLLSYVRTSFGNSASPIEGKMVSDARVNLAPKED